MGRRPKQTLFERGNVDGQQVYEKMFDVVNHQGIANQNHNQISPQACQNGCHEKEHKKQIVVRMWRNLEHCW